VFEVRDAIYGILDRNRNLLFDLLGGNPRPLGDDLDVVIGDVGIGFYRETAKGNDSPDKQEDCDGDNE
jgi:hypothetical protein